MYYFDLINWIEIEKARGMHIILVNYWTRLNKKKKDISLFRASIFSEL